MADECDTERCDNPGLWNVRDANLKIGGRLVNVGDVRLCGPCFADLRRTGRLNLRWAKILPPDAAHPAIRK